MRGLVARAERVRARASDAKERDGSVERAQESNRRRGASDGERGESSGRDEEGSRREGKKDGKRNWEEARKMRKDAEEMRIDAEEFLERQKRAEKAEAKMEEKGRDIERMKEWSNERMDELEIKQEQVAVANAACEREASLLKRDYERFEKNRREISRAFGKERWKF